MSAEGVSTGAVGGSPPIEGVRAKATLPVALLLFPPASVLAYMTRNLNEIALPDVVPALAGALACALAVWLVVVLLRRRADAGAAVISALWVVAGLYYLGLFGALNTWIGGDYTLAATLPFVVAGLLAASWATHRAPALHAPIHVVLSAIAVVMLATPLWAIAGYAWRNGDVRAAYDPDAAATALAGTAGPATPAAGGAARPPDVYHFVFDRFGSQDTLERRYGINSNVGDLLRRRGFYVASRSHSNYLKTGHSLASTFYMDYLDLLSDDARIDGAGWHAIFAMLQDHRAARILRERGYRFHQFGSWWRGTHRNAFADENRPHGFSEFTMYYLRHTALRTVLGVLPQSRLAGLLDWDNGQCDRVAAQVEEIKAIGAQDAPVYVFAHFLMPHDPFVFAPDGRCLPLAEANARGGEQGYLDQVAYAERIIADLVGALQDREAPPAILIQADEGPYPDRDYTVPWQDADPEDLRIKTGILNAYFFPDKDYRDLRPDISPVNSYRALFNAYFGTDYPILPDRVFAFPEDTQLYRFHDVTERVREGATSAGASGPRPGSGAMQ